MNKKQKSSRAESLKKLLVPVLIVLLALGLAAASWFGIRYKQAQSEIKNLKQGETAKQQAENLIKQVGKLMVLPTDEEPTIATVTDLEKLKDQVFFASAKLEDKVLIYTKAKKAILYRPSDNKIIEIAPLNIDQEAPNPPPPTANISQISIRVLNGSGVSGQARSVETKIKAAGYTNTSVGDTQSSDQTIILYKAGFAEQANAINQLINNQGVLRQQSDLATDIVITLGKGFKPA